MAAWTIALLLAAPVHATDKTAEIPVLIAETVDPHGNPLPTPPVAAAVIGLLAQETGLNLTIRAYPWRRALIMAEHGEGLLYGASSTPERQNIFMFTKPIYSSHHWLVSTEKAPLVFRGWEDLRGKVISIGGGSKFDPEFEARRDTLFKIEQNAASTESRMKMLSAHHVDAVLLDSFRNPEQLIVTLNCRYRHDRWTVSDKPVGFEPMRLAVPKSGPLSQLLPVLDGAITRLSKAGGIQKAVDSVARLPDC
ncbi:substrate-binding periplasmic protein [Duganella radicis]|uniref:substrate-binding periplasmic protein n=1 Tax=Duganella radicis TaxID=551988 RepID=UPI001478F3B2|nr:transporter substrate-binding domain-containing protein [Duganella radicis]